MLFADDLVTTSTAVKTTKTAVVAEAPSYVTDGATKTMKHLYVIENGSATVVDYTDFVDADDAGADLYNLEAGDIINLGLDADGKVVTDAAQEGYTEKLTPGTALVSTSSVTSSSKIDDLVKQSDADHQTEAYYYNTSTKAWEALSWDDVVNMIKDGDITNISYNKYKGVTNLVDVMVVS